MLSINTNLSSLIAQSSMKSSTSKLNQAIERMTTGFKINGARDNAANYSISTNLTTKINSYMIAEDNVSMGLDMLSSASGTLDQINEKLTRLRALATQAGNGTYGAQSMLAINSEVNALIDEINRLYSTAEYNGIKFFEPTQVDGLNGSTETSGPGFANKVEHEDTSGLIALSDMDEGASLAVDTYSISTADELQQLARMTNAGLVEAGSTFVLANDIDLSGISDWESIGKFAFNADGSAIDTNKTFSGTFDGNGYVIKNLKQVTLDYDASTGYGAGGLFGATNDATIKDLGVENIDIITSDTGTAGLVGGVIGYADGDITISNCYTTGNITANDGFLTYVAGVIGAVGMFALAGNVIIENSNSYINPNVSDHTILAFGGLAGGIQANKIKVSNCTYEGSVIGNENSIVAGLCSISVAATSGTFENCTVKADIVSNNTQSGELFAQAQNITVSNTNYKSNGLSLTVDEDNVIYNGVKELDKEFIGKFYSAFSRRDTSSMTKLSSISSSTAISSGTYSISTAAELEKLATMTNNGLITGGEFVLANDIDLSGYSNWTPIGTEANDFTGTFDGNGYEIKNLTCIQTGEDSSAGLFGSINNGDIRNLGIVNAKVSGAEYVGILAGLAGQKTTITNCYTRGTAHTDFGPSSGFAFVGGLVGCAAGKYLDVQKCWTDVAVNSSDVGGGIIGGGLFSTININSSFSKGDVTARNNAAGLIGLQYCFDSNGTDVGMITKVTNSFALGEISGAGIVAGVLISAQEIFNNSVSNCYYNSDLNPSIDGLYASTNNALAGAVQGKTTAQLEAMIPEYIKNGGASPTMSGSSSAPRGFDSNLITFQVGINSDASSQIALDFAFSLEGIDEIRQIGADTTIDYISKIDEMIAIVSAKQTKYGSAQNRLESALDEIATQYENLVSTRSTIRDADIAEESSEYIRQQILQQASATLLATANQSPSIALQLI